MADALTERLKRQFAARADSYMDSVQRSVPEPVPTSQAQGGSMYDQFAKEQYPGWYDTDDTTTSSDFINASGASLWSFADTASFGLFGYGAKALGVDVEEFIDFDDPLAKWGAGIAGFMGFVAGAPMKLGVRATQAALRPLARSVLKRTGQKTVDDVVRAASKIGKDGKLSKKAIDNVMKGYKNVVRDAQLNPNMWGRTFQQNVAKYLDTYLAKGIGKEISNAEARAIREMFTKGRMGVDRPVQDIIGAMVARGGNTRFNRWAGHAIKDAVMFGGIDTVFESVRYVGENTVGEGNYSFNKWAPFWGGVNGLAFASLGWLNPKGKAAKWKPDFVEGLKSSFAYNPYKKKTLEQLTKTARFWDGQLKDQGKKRILEVGGKRINLGAKSLQSEIELQLGDKAVPAMRIALNKLKRSEGRQMMKWATTQEAANMWANKGRMFAGGMLFNAHTFWDMYANDMEADIHDILPHFLIGAWVQRQSNPAKVDLNSRRMNQLRENLTILGTDPAKLSRIPTFDGVKSRLTNVYNETRFEGNEKLAEELGIITNNFEEAGIPLRADQKSIAMEPDPLFDLIYRELKGRRQYIKSKDDISVTDAKQIVENAIKIEPNLKNPLKRDEVFGESYMKTTEAFEEKFKEIIDYIEEVDVDNVTGIRTAIESKRSGNEPVTRVPSHISFEPLMAKAEKGELIWLKDKSGEVLKGDEAMIALSEAADSFNQILLSSRMLTQVSLIEPVDKRQRKITDENLVNEIFQKVTRTESEITEMYPNRASYADEFSYAKDANEYALMITHNYSVKLADKTVNIFKTDFADNDALVSLLTEAGLMHLPAGVGKAKVIDIVDKLIINTGREKTDPERESEIAEAKRFLGRVLGLQSIVGMKTYEGHTLNKGEKSVKLEDVNALKSFLKGYGLNLSEMPDYMFQKIQSFALREVVKGTDLSIEQANSLFNLAAEYGIIARFSTRAEGESGGFRVKTISESLAEPLDVEKVREYNQNIRKMVKDSNGLVQIEGEVFVPNPGVLQGIYEALPRMWSADAHLSARKSIEELLQAVHSSKKSYSSLVEQMRQFVNANDSNAIRLQKWLTQLGVLEAAPGQMTWNKNINRLNDLLDPTSKDNIKVKVTEREATDVDGNIKVGYNIDGKGNYYKDVGRKVYEDLSRRMNDAGWTATYAEAQYEKYEKKARDNLLRDADESTYDEGITLNEFFKIYRVDDPRINFSLESGEAQQKLFNELIYDTADSKILQLDVFQNLLNRLYVQRRGAGFVKYNREQLPETVFQVLPRDERPNRRNGILHHITGLLAQQKAQVRVNVMKWENGQIKEGFEVMQASRFFSYLNGDLQIPYQIVDPRAVVYELSGDGRFVRKVVVDIFGETPNLSEESRVHLQNAKDNFERILTQKLTTTPDETSTQSGLGEIGITMMQLLPNMEPIAIQNQHLRNIESPFLAFADTYSQHADVSETVRSKLREITAAINSDRPVTPDHYNEALKHLVSKQMLTGSDGDALFIKYLNGTIDIPKLMKRIRLFNSKAFVFTNNDFVLELADIHERFGNVDVKDNLRKFARRRGGRGGFEVGVWNDVDFANLKVETQRHLSDLGIDPTEWNFDHAIGKAHQDKSGFDSIAYVSRDMMMFSHTTIGHDPYSFTPIKPIINSNGDLSPLLLGKTLFVHSPKLDTFFRANDMDILIARSGAKAYNSVEGEGVNDLSLINVGFEGLNGHVVRGAERRTITMESVGLKVEKDYYQHTAKEAVADQNYATNEESTRWFNDQYRDQLATNLQSIETIMQNPITTKEWILEDFGNDKSLSSALQESDGIAHLNSIAWFSGLSRDANPMSYSDTIVKNKLYQVYIDKLLNGSRSVTNQFEIDGSDRYGGQAILIQTPDTNRLKPTVVTKDGKILSRGEVRLAAHEWNSDIRNFMKDGMSLRFVIAGKKLDYDTMGKGAKDMFIGEEIFGESGWKDIMDSAAEGGVTLGSLHEQVKAIAAADPTLEGLSIGIVTRRNPRTRPNDMSILGLKGFLEAQYGNSLEINSLDVANVYEGDYDVDKADYWFAQRDNFYSHVDRASQFYVQGIDPTDLMMKDKFRWGDPSDKVIKNVNKMAANLNLYKSSIGRVQKVPRYLGYMDKVGYETIADSEFYKGYNDSHKRSKIGETAKLILGGNKNDNYTITLDYNNLDYFIRSALETQYIIDGSGDINPNIARNIDSWSDGFLFPRIADSVSPGEAKVGGADFINDIRTGGNSGGKRVRIFRKVEKVGETYKEVDLSELDIAILKEMMLQYSSLLKVTRDSMFENTGEKTRVSYEDVIDASEEFFLFNRDLNNSLYYRLRKKIIDRDDPRKKKWAEDDSEGGFQERFGVTKKTYTQFGKEKEYFVATRDAIHEGMKANGKAFFNGERGAPIERVLQRLYKSDPFERTRVREVSGDVVGIMDSWYNELLGGADTGDISRMADRLNRELSRGVFGFNKKVNVIGSMKKKAAQIQNNYKIPWKTKKASLDKLNQSINKIEQEITPLIPESYWATRKKKDLKLMKIVPIDAKNLKQGTIYMTTMESVKDMLPGTRGHQNFALSTGGQALVKEIKALRKIFYGNRTRLKEIYEYADKTILTSAQRKLLERFPDLSTFYNIETQLLLQGFRDYGPQFIYNFMQPANNKHNVGIFEGKLIPVPYEASETYDPSSRYRRGMKFLTTVAKGEMRDMEGNKIDPETVSTTREGLKLIQFIEAQWQRFFHRQFDLKDMVMREVGDYSDLRLSDAISDTEMMIAKSNIYSQMRLPSINRDVKRMFTSFRGIQWNKGRDRISHGSDLTNDHLYDLYSDIMAIAGKTDEFQKYRETINDIEAQMINNEIIDPVEYIALRSRLDKDVMNIASTVFTGGLTNETGKTKYVKNIQKNPVYILMGGKDYFKGYSFETAAKRNVMQRMKEMIEMSTNVRNMKNNINVEAIEAKKSLDELIEACG